MSRCMLHESCTILIFHIVCLRKRTALLSSSGWVTSALCSARGINVHCHSPDSRMRVPWTDTACGDRIPQVISQGCRYPSASPSHRPPPRGYINILAVMPEMRRLCLRPARILRYSCGGTCLESACVFAAEQDAPGLRIRPRKSCDLMEVGR